MFRYNAFLICLGMVRPMQADGVWETNHLAYDRYMASLLPRGRHYLQKALRTDITDLLEECNVALAAAWEIGGAGCGDEALVPHTGGRSIGLCQYIARKPHSIGIKLYVLCDNTHGCVLDVYLCTGRRGRLRRYGSCSGNLDAKGIVRFWAMQIPDTTALCCDSFFGSHNIARELAGKGQLFLLLTKRDKTDETLNEAHRATKEGQAARAIVKGAKYEVVVCKNPKVGHKPPRLVPFVTNLWFPEEGPQHRRTGEELNPVVAAYRDFLRVVDGANQMALQMRQLRRQMTWSHAV